jgi:hypothetical protein
MILEFEDTSNHGEVLRVEFIRWMPDTGKLDGIGYLRGGHCNVWVATEDGLRRTNVRWRE